MREDIRTTLSEFNHRITFYHKREAQEIEEFISDKETVIFFMTGNVRFTKRSKTMPGVLTVTDKRIIFYQKTLKSSKEAILIQFSLNEILSVKHKNNLSGHIVITTSRDTFDFHVTPDKEIRTKIIETITKAIDEHIKNYGCYQPNAVHNIKKHAKGVLCPQCQAPANKDAEFCVYCGINFKL